MAFTFDSFSPDQRANSAAPRIHTYRTNDAEAVIEGAGYFNDLSDILQVGDLIFIHVDADGTDTAEFTWVTANAAGVVTIQGLGAITAD
jgi:hypothetical protein